MLINFIKSLLPSKLSKEVKERIKAQALEIFEDPRIVEIWLTTPKFVLNGLSPLRALETPEGAKAVGEILYRAEYGMF